MTTGRPQQYEVHDGFTVTQNGDDLIVTLRAGANQTQPVLKVTTHDGSITTFEIDAAGNLTGQGLQVPNFTVNNVQTTMTDGVTTTGQVYGTQDTINGVAKKGLIVSGNKFVGVGSGDSVVMQSASPAVPHNDYFTNHYNNDPGTAGPVVSMWVNEAGNALTFKVLYSDGTTFKSGTVALA